MHCLTSTSVHQCGTPQVDLQPFLLQGCRVIAEGVVDKPADLDIATVFSMGFPPYYGGLIFWADRVGAKHICERLQGWAKQFGAAGLAGFFEPSEYLCKCAESGRKLSEGPTPVSKL